MTQTTESLTPGVQILHFEDYGYGPNGSMKRKDWRAECLKNLLAGKGQFEAWQNTWKYSKNDSLPSVDIGITVLHANDTSKLSVRFLSTRPYALDFSGHLFDETFNAYGYTFETHAYFNGATFTNGANFHSAKFKQSANLRLAVFEKNTEFRNASFASIAHFNDATFVNYAIFANAEFDELVYFSGAHFGENAIFNEVTFRNDTHFTNTTFELIAGFRLANFHGDANFKGAWFLGEANFFNAQLLKQCRFDVQLGEMCEMDHWIQLHRFTQFRSFANFENALIEKVGHFEGVEFKTAPPSFRGVDIGTTRLEFSNDYFFPNDSNTQQAIDDISFLKRLSDEHGQTDQALNFNAMELRAKRRQEGAGWGFVFFTWLYELVSNFGRSFVRPLIAYFVLLIFTLGVSFEHAASTARAVKNCPAHVDWYKSMEWVDGTENCPSEYYKNLTGAKKDKEDEAWHLDGFRAAFEYTLYRSSGILDFADSDKKTSEVAQRLFGQPIEPGYMRAWGVFKAIASTALLFLAALGLRNKYRIK